MIGLLVLILWICVLAFVVYGAWILIDMIPVPAQMAVLKQILKVIVGLIALIYVLGMLLGYAPPPPRWWKE